MILELEKVTKLFSRRGKEFAAVDDVSLEVNPQDFILIGGKSGNGKTTLLNLMMGLLRPSHGKVWVDGKDLNRLGDEELSALRRETIGMVTQQQTLLSSLTVLDNVVLPRVLPGMKKKAGSGESVSKLPINRAIELLERLGLNDLAHAYPGELSGGEMRRVSIARALIAEPAILLADEPTGDLDDQSTRQVLDLLTELQKQGTAVVMVTHDPIAKAYALQEYRMEEGRLFRVNSEDAY